MMSVTGTCCAVDVGIVVIVRREYRVPYTRLVVGTSTVSTVDDRAKVGRTHTDASYAVFVAHRKLLVRLAAPSRMQIGTIVVKNPPCPVPCVDGASTSTSAVAAAVACSVAVRKTRSGFIGILLIALLIAVFVLFGRIVVIGFIARFKIFVSVHLHLPVSSVEHNKVIALLLFFFVSNHAPQLSERAIVKIVVTTLVQPLSQRVG